MNVKRFITFCFVGIGAFLIDWVFFNFFYFLGAGFVISKVFSTIISMIFNFTTNRNYTFKTKGASLSTQVPKWLGLYIFSGAANILVGKAVLSLLGEGTLNANIAFFSGLTVSIPLNFLGSSLWVFKKKVLNEENLKKC